LLIAIDIKSSTNQVSFSLLPCKTPSRDRTVLKYVVFVIASIIDRYLWISQIQQCLPKLTPAQISRIAVRGHMRAMELGEVLYEQGESAYFSSHLIRVVLCGCLRRA
jgi:hypothetical protein